MHLRSTMLPCGSHMHMARGWVVVALGLLNAATSACSVEANPEQECMVSAQ